MQTKINYYSELLVGDSGPLNSLGKRTIGLQPLFCVERKF